jgi:hypothetical protein
MAHCRCSRHPWERSEAPPKGGKGGSEVRKLPPEGGDADHPWEGDRVGGVAYRGSMNPSSRRPGICVTIERP